MKVIENFPYELSLLEILQSKCASVLWKVVEEIEYAFHVQ